jgi:hypothetical protein
LSKDTSFRLICLVVGHFLVVWIFLHVWESAANVLEWTRRKLVYILNRVLIVFTSNVENLASKFTHKLLNILGVFFLLASRVENTLNLMQCFWTLFYQQKLVESFFDDASALFTSVNFIDFVDPGEDTVFRHLRSFEEKDRST